MVKYTKSIRQNQKKLKNLPDPFGVLNQKKLCPTLIYQFNIYYNDLGHTSLLCTLKYRIKEQYGINEQGELFSEN